MANTSDMMHGASALVTGGASGIGLACVQRFVANGRRVVMVDKDPAALQLAMRGLDPTQVLPVQADLTDRASPAAVEAEISRQGFGPVLVLVNNAGMAPKHSGRSHNLLAIDPLEWDTVIELNLTSAMFMTRQFLPGMVAQKWGRIVMMSSLAGRGRSVISGPAYMASKAGLLGLMRHVAVQFGQYGVTSNAIAPGRVATKLGAQLDSTIAARAMADNPLGYEAKPADVAAVVGFLTSEDAKFCNGAVMDVNGGTLMM
jgi:3-oxoacyl-[acyl-carrier protein] reductase